MNFRGCIRSGMKASILDLIKVFIRTNFRSRRHIIKRCGLSPTESLLYKTLSPLKSLLITVHPKVFTTRTTRLLRRELMVLFNLLTEDVSEVAVAVKKFLSSKFNNRWLEYSIGKIRNKLSDAKTAEALTAAALEKHKTTLGESVPEISAPDLERVRQITRQLLEGIVFDFEKIPAISQKSCLEVPLREGGKVAALSEERYRVFQLTALSAGQGEIPGTRNPTIVITDDEGCEAVIYSAEWRNEVFASYLREYNRSQVKAAIAPGPLKARVITKETCGSQFLEPIRKAVWKRLRKWPMFLIDRPPTVEDIPVRRPDEFYVSGDYTAATDGFHPEVSAAICDEVGKLASEWIYDTYWEDRSVRNNLQAGLSTDETREAFLVDVVGNFRQILRETMVGKTVEYPDGDVIEQKRGQLMGNLMSFPVLCIYNFCVFQMSVEKTAGGPRRPLERRVRINGDDIIFPSTQGKYISWKHSCDELGMELNDRKTQLSKTRCSLNSTEFAEAGTSVEGKLLRKAYWHYVPGLLGRGECRIKQAEQVRRERINSFDPEAPGFGIFIHKPIAVIESTKRCRIHRDGLVVLGEVLRV